MSARRWPVKPVASLSFVTIFCIILTMYGGGFATIPAYLADLFGTQHVGAIHGRLLTAWSVAGIIGPVAVNYIREFQLARGVPPDQAYNITMYVLAAMLLGGLICNTFIRPVNPRHHMSPEQLAAERSSGHEQAAAPHRRYAGSGKHQSAPVHRMDCDRHSTSLGRMDNGQQVARAVQVTGMARFDDVGEYDFLDHGKHSR